MLVSKRITLRAVEPTDVDYLFKEENNREIWHLSNTLIPFSKNTLRDYANSIHDLSAQKQFRFIIELSEVKKIIGMVDLFEYDAINERVGVGIVITDNEKRNEGYALEALSNVIKYAKHTLMLNQVFCSIHASNIVSIKLFEKLEFKKMGVRKNWYKKSDGSWEDELEYQLILV